MLDRSGVSDVVDAFDHGRDRAQTEQQERHDEAPKVELPSVAEGVLGGRSAPGPLAARSTRAVVRATASGAVLATLTPSGGYDSFTWVTGAADDRTFVLAAYGRGGLPRFRQESVTEYLRQVEDLRGRGIPVGVAPHSVRACPEEWLEEIGRYAASS